jgi:hypothetical protein
MGTEVATEEIPRIVGEHSGALPPLPSHELVYERAMARLAELAAGWQEARDSLTESVGEPQQADRTTPEGTVPEEDSGTSTARRPSAKRWRRRPAA